MSDGVIRIRVGATADRSIDTVFGGVEKRALKARDNINKALGGAGGGPIERSMEAADRASRRAADSVDKTWNAELARLNKFARLQDQLYARVEANKVKQAEASARARAKVEERLARDVEKSTREGLRRAERAERERANASAALDRQRSRAIYQQHREAEGIRRQFAERTAWRATKFLVPPPIGALGHGQRIVGGLLRGAGIDFSLQSSVQRAVSLQQDAVQLANSAYIPGAQGLASQRANPAELEKFVRETAPKFGMSSGDTMEALKAFVGRTGDLATAKATLPGLLKLGAATGANPQDLLTFAGTVGATVFDSPAKNAEEAAQRAAMINRTANVAAASGKLGTTEISDLAKYGPKLAATAQAFGGDPEKNLGEMYALAQLGLKGGAASAAQATTSVASMVNTLKTPARRKQFKAAGVSLENEDGTFRSASDIITESIVAAGSDTEKFKKMWANVQGARSVEGLRNIYLKAGGGKAGEEAVRGQFKALGGGAMSQADIDKGAGDQLNTVGGRAKVFQERYDAVIGKMTQAVLPALEKLADPTIKLANTFASVAKFAADMPLTFGGLVAAAAILRAGLESWARSALERRIMGLPTGTPGVPGSGPGGPSAGGPVIGGIFSGGGGFTGARGVLNSTAMAVIAPMAAAAAIDAARDQNASLTKETGGKGILDVGWEWITTNKGLKQIADENLDQQAKQRAVDEGRVAKPGGGDGEGKNAPTLSAEDMQRALENANSRGIRITNLGDIKPTPPAPVVDAYNRQPPVGAR